MGRDKALLTLDERPLLDHAVAKLRRVCSEVRVLSGREELSGYAPLVPDLHPNCGPLSGMEAGLTHSTFRWNLFLAIDMPFLPSAFVHSWVQWFLTENDMQNRAAGGLFVLDGLPQPGFCLLHRDLLPFLTAALQRGEYKLFPVLERAARELAKRKGFLPEKALWRDTVTELLASLGGSTSESRVSMTVAQQEAMHLWFANLNTPDEFAVAERHLNALDT